MRPCHRAGQVDSRFIGDESALSSRFYDESMFWDGQELNIQLWSKTNIKLSGEVQGISIS